MKYRSKLLIICGFLISCSLRLQAQISNNEDIENELIKISQEISDGITAGEKLCGKNIY